MLKIGDRMPEFEVVDQDGNVVSSKDFIECWRGLSRRWTQRTTLPRFSADGPGVIASYQWVAPTGNLVDQMPDQVGHDVTARSGMT